MYSSTRVQANNVRLYRSFWVSSVVEGQLGSPRPRGPQASQVDVEESLPGPRSDVPGSAFPGRLHEPAHPPDERQDVAGGGARVHRAGRNGAGGELVQCGPYPVHGRVLGTALDEQVRVAGVVGERLAQGPQELFEPGPVGARQRPAAGGQDLLEGQPQQLVDQGVLAGEVTVDGTDAHASPRAAGISRPASAASASPAAITANPVV